MRVFDDLSGRAFRFQVLNSWKNKNSSNVLTLSYMGGGGGGGGLLALISKTRIFATSTPTATKFGDFS